jgi:hypothetical protein
MTRNRDRTSPAGRRSARLRHGRAAGWAASGWAPGGRTRDHGQRRHVPAGRVRTRWVRSRRLAGQAPDPFALLGLDPAADLTDSDVLAAWRRIAATTHPDRADGGDPAGFAAAAAAYTDLRTRSGRGEARAVLAVSRQWRRHGPAAGQPWTLARRLVARIRLGRPVRLALRVLAAAAAAAAASLAAGPGPAGPALRIGVLTWLVLTVRRDMSPP